MSPAALRLDADPRPKAVLRQPGWAIPLRETSGALPEAAVAAGQQESPVAPLTAEEWERAVAATPDSAVAWVGYMANVMQVSAVTGDI